MSDPSPFIALSRWRAPLGEGRIRVNSRHHQGLAPEMAARGLRATALSPDGLVEALEGERQRWLVSMQWHPERPEMAETMAPLFSAFVQAYRGKQEGSRSSFDRLRTSGLEHHSA